MFNDRAATRLQEEVQKLLTESTEQWTEAHHSAIEIMVREQVRAFVARGVPAENLELVEHVRHQEFGSTVISYYIRIRPEKIGT
jgi:hypothetical protein